MNNIKNVVVLTSGSLNPPEHLAKRVSVMSATPEAVVEKLGDQGFEHLYIDGGNTIQRFLQAGLIQEFILTHIPILIGTGISLFGRLNHDIKLQHITTTTFENGFVQSRYQLNHNDR
ncbi:MAG: dihydrofolate reductase family protein [Balneolaceae bacterium]|nr:dihydrofolate reductase family protein [Balneolaceae bacterium]